MAMGNWASQMWTSDGRPLFGSTFTSMLDASLCITVYKNYLDIEDVEAWARKKNPRYRKPIVRRIERGGRQDDYRDFRILTYRGPQDGLYGAIWAYDPLPRGVFFAGVMGHDGTGEWVGLQRSSRTWFERKLNGDLGGRLPWDVFGRLVLS
jgi:hypothetical protein